MSETPIELERVLSPTQEHVEAFAHLLPQLSQAEPPTLAELTEITDNRATYVFVARQDGKIVGSLCLATFAIPTGLRAWIEDVVVDEAGRGKGIGAALIRHAVATATGLGAVSIDLTSRPTRVDANRLYQRLGFQPRETNVYRHVRSTE